MAKVVLLSGYDRTREHWETKMEEKGFKQVTAPGPDYPNPENGMHTVGTRWAPMGTRVWTAFVKLDHGAGPPDYYNRIGIDLPLNFSAVDFWYEPIGSVAPFDESVTPHPGEHVALDQAFANYRGIYVECDRLQYNDQLAVSYQFRTDAASFGNFWIRLHAILIERE